jgi:hypothetical protein
MNATQRSIVTPDGSRADGQPATHKDKLRAWLDDLERQQFYGSVTCKFEDGHVTYVRVEQGFKPQDLTIQSGTPRNYGTNRNQ